MKNLLYILLSSLPAVANAQLWLPLDEGVSCDEQVTFSNAITDMYYDQSLNRIDIMGIFRYNGECEENRGLAFWDGENWNNYPSACIIPPSSIIAFQDEKYVCGGIVCGETTDSYNNFYKLEDNNWSIISEFPDLSGGTKLRIINNRLLLGCRLDPDENGEVPLLVEYFPASGNYSVLAKNEGFSMVKMTEILVYNDTIFLSGKFDNLIFGQPDNLLHNIVKISDSTVAQVAHGMNGNSNAYSMCVHRDTLFIGGIFGSENFPGFTTEQYVFLIYYYNGELKPYPIQANGYVTTLLSNNDILYVGGWFTQLGEVQCNGIGALINSEIVSLNSAQMTIAPDIPPTVAYMESVNKLLVIDDHLYMAGRFEYIGEDGPYGNIAKLSTPLSEFSKVIEDKSEWEMKLYPNPAEEFITLEIPLGAQGTFQIINNLGQLVRQEKISQVKTDISISNLTSGAYHCVFRTPNNTISERMIIQ